MPFLQPEPYTIIVNEVLMKCNPLFCVFGLYQKLLVMEVFRNVCASQTGLHENAPCSRQRERIWTTAQESQPWLKHRLDAITEKLL